jgi:hypothetical protein
MADGGFGGVVARLEALASGFEGRVELGPAVSDDEMSSWLVSPPEDVRVFFRRVGGFTFGRYRFDFNHPANHIDAVEGDYYPLRDRSANWILDDGMGASTTYYVDIDAESGEWGPVFSFWRDPYASLVAPSFLTWLDNLITGTSIALEASRGGDADPARVFSEWLYGSEESLFRNPDHSVEPLSVPAALASGDVALAEVAARLPEDAFLADLRGAGYPTEVPFANVMEMASFSRFEGGRFLAATPIPFD